MSDLEAKRQAVLLSMRRSKASTPTPMTPETKEKLYEAVLDLRSLGFSLEEICSRSVVDREFLIELYKEWNFPVDVIPEYATAPVVENTVPQQEVYEPKKWSFYSNKVYRNEPRPEWLKDLVINLESSDDDSEHEEGEEEEEEQLPRKRRLSHVQQMNIEDVEQAKELVNEMIEMTNKQIEQKENEDNVRLREQEEIQGSIDSYEKQLAELQRKMEDLKQKLNEAKRLKTDEVLSSTDDLKHQLSTALHKLDILNKREQQLDEDEKRRLQLKEKLLNQIKKKQQSQSYDETIHKIPKVITDTSSF
jgi:hypothetical protein